MAGLNTLAKTMKQKRPLYTLLVVITMFITSNATSAQVMWNLKGGIMKRDYKFCNGSNYSSSTSEIHTDSRIDWTAGLEIEIPLSNRLNIETGARYRSHHSLSLDGEYSYTDSWGDEHHSYNSIRNFSSHVEIPVRVAWKQPLGKYFTMHAGLGPYVRYSPGAFTDGGGINKKMQVGLEPSVCVNWNCLSLGAFYNVPCFYKGYKDENKPAVMVTLGIRFRSHVWKYVGAGMLAVASVGAAVAAVWPESSNYTSSNYNNYGSYGTETSSGSSLPEQYKMWERRAKMNYESLTNTGTRTKKNGKDVSGTNGQSLSPSNYQLQKRTLHEAQQNMYNIRTKAAKQGITIQKSPYETVKVNY